MEIKKMTKNENKALKKAQEEIHAKFELKQLRLNLKYQKELSKSLADQVEKLQNQLDKQNSQKTVTKQDNDKLSLLQSRLGRLNFKGEFKFDGGNKEFENSYKELRQIVNDYLNENSKKKQ